MPIYRALSQNTYKFVQEATININQDIDNAGRNFAIPCVKLLDRSNVPIAIGVLSPVDRSNASYNSTTLLYMEASSTEPTANSYVAYSMQGYADVDGVRYVGVKNASFETCFYNLPTGAYIIPACTITIVKYNSTSGLIETEVVNKAQINHTQSSSSYYTHVSLAVQKHSNDLILGINIEFAS